MNARNPFGLDDIRLYLYLNDVELSAAVDVRTAAGARAAVEEVERRLAEDPGLAARTARAIEKNRVHFAAYGWQPLIPDASAGAPADPVPNGNGERVGEPEAAR
jgi:hypothetical protein